MFFSKNTSFSNHQFSGVCYFSGVASVFVGGDPGGKDPCVSAHVLFSP